MNQNCKKITINKNLLDKLLEEINLFIKTDIEEEQPFKYPYILGFSEALIILKNKYNLEIELEHIDNNVFDKMISEIITNLKN